jgi:hypothetical protein
VNSHRAIAGRTPWAAAWSSILGRGLVALLAAVAGVTGARLLPGSGAVPSVEQTIAPRTPDALAQLPLAAQGPVSAALGSAAPAFGAAGVTVAAAAPVGAVRRHRRSRPPVAGRRGHRLTP